MKKIYDYVIYSLLALIIIVVIVLFLPQKEDPVVVQTYTLDVKTTGSYDNKDELNLRYSGPVGIAIDATGLFKNADFKLLAATVLLALVLLILIYRSPLLAIIPLIAVGLLKLICT